MYYAGFVVSGKNKVVRILSRIAFIAILPSVLLLGYISFSFKYSMEELKERIDVVPGSRYINLEPLWVYSTEKKWTFQANRKIRLVLEYYQERSEMKDFVFISDCGVYCLVYKNKLNSSMLTIRLNSNKLGTKVEYLFNDR